MRHFGNKTRTLAEKRVACLSLLTMRRTLDGLTPEGLAHSYGVSVPEATALLAAEQDRRRARA